MTFQSGSQYKIHITFDEQSIARIQRRGISMLTQNIQKIKRIIIDKLKNWFESSWVTSPVQDG